MSEEMKMQQSITIPDFFNKTVEKFGDRPALMHKDINCDKWTSITYKEYHEKVEKIAKAFMKLGLEQYGSVSVLAFNCPEWFISQLATIHAG
jgi:long-chain-fatty-acid--CoA ligase ACSBG